jgi:4-aminobutyrate aminotransferase / (S)-3-amino-2-methylpropionate transaminase / 5-aminovalerate transaminase
MFTLGQSAPQVLTEIPGPASEWLAERMLAVECPAFEARREQRETASGTSQAPIVYGDGLGSNVTDADGNVLVDLVAGFGSVAFGHGHPRLAEVLRRQAESLWVALGDVYASEAKVRLAEKLASIMPEPGARVMLGSSGADAVTAAMKTAAVTTGKPHVVAFEGSYHGLSHGPLAACGVFPAFRDPFEAQLGSFVSFAPFPGVRGATVDESLSAVKALLARGDHGAVLVEPILGRGGCIVPPYGFLEELRALCTNHGVLLICDEVWTGCGRAGSMAVSLSQSLLPDLLCLGKALGGGFPISACIGRESAMAGWGKLGGTSVHTATHFGLPLGCTVALTALDLLVEDDLFARAETLGTWFILELREVLVGLGVKRIDGRGLMIGVELEGGSARALAVARRVLSQGWIVLTGGMDGATLTLTPALTISQDLLESFVATLAKALRAEKW